MARIYSKDGGSAEGSQSPEGEVRVDQDALLRKTVIRGDDTGRDAPVRKTKSRKQRAELFNKHAGLCHICQGKILVGEDWEIEHIIPIALGGEDSGDNLALAHKSCHRQKTKADVGRVAKAKRQRSFHLRGKVTKQPLPFGKSSKLKRKLDGTVVKRWTKD